jgi:large subunit ribosomal protein L3
MVEFRLDEGHEYELGDTVGISVLSETESVDVTGTTKGRGFSGNIKRHGHHRGPDGHGSKNVRASGSIGMHTFPGRVLPGKAMPGQYGNKQETKKNLKVVAVDEDKNLILVRGSVPGHKNGIVFIRPSR